MIAILSSEFSQTVEWVRLNFKILKKNINGRHFTTEDGKEYFIVGETRHTYGMKFTNFIKAPDYHSLEDDVKIRIR